MALRHDDDLPPLTPGQQAEAIRLAARLQEEETARQDLLLAAEEAGIEPRFMREAAHRVASTPQERFGLRNAAPSALDWIQFACLALGFILLSTAYVAWMRQGMGDKLPLALVLATLECAVLARFWMMRKRSAVLAFTMQMTTWLALDLVLNVVFGGPTHLGEYLPVLGTEAALSLSGVALAWWILAVADARRPRVGHNPRA